MKIAITGGSGRVGRAVTDLALARGHTVVSLDRAAPAPEWVRSEVSYAQVDVTNYALLEDALRGCQGLVHLAAIISPRSDPDYVVHNHNVTGSYNALSAAARLGIQCVAQASSVNATGALFSRQPRWDYFPVDEQHPTYNEDPYSLSKWICEAQGASFGRRYEHMTIASLRLHWVTPQRPAAANQGVDRAVEQGGAKHLWGYTTFDAAARACLQVMQAPYRGHETFYIIAPDTLLDTPSLELARRYYPGAPVRGDLSGQRSFFDCSKAERLLAWKHNEESV